MSGAGRTLQAVNPDSRAHTVRAQMTFSDVGGGGSASQGSPERPSAPASDSPATCSGVDHASSSPGELRATLYASLEEYRPVVAHWQVERSSQPGLHTFDPAAQTVEFHETNEEAFDANHLETVMERALATWHQLAAADGLEPVDGPRVRVHSAPMDDGQRGDLYVSAWVRRAGAADTRPTPRQAVVEIEVPAGARPGGYAYVHDAQLDGDENLQIGTRVQIRDEGGNYLPAIVDDIVPHGSGRQYRLRLGH